MKKVLVLVVMSTTAFGQQTLNCGTFQARARTLIVDGQSYLDKAIKNKAPIVTNMALAHSHFFAAQDMLKIACPGSTQAITQLGDTITLIEKAMDQI